VLIVTALIGAETHSALCSIRATAISRLPRLTMAWCRSPTLMLLNRPPAGSRPIPEAVFRPALLAGAALYRVQRRPEHMNHCGLARCIFCSPYAVAGGGPCKSQNKQARIAIPRQADIVEHDPNSAAISPPVSRTIDGRIR